MAKDNGQKIAECFQTLKDKTEEAQEKIMSPYGMAYMQLNETISNTGMISELWSLNSFTFSTFSQQKRGLNIGTTLGLRNPEVQYRQRKLEM